MHRPAQSVLLLGDVRFGSVDLLKTLQSTQVLRDISGVTSSTGRVVRYASAAKRFTFFEPAERFIPIERGRLIWWGSFPTRPSRA